MKLQTRFVRTQIASALLAALLGSVYSATQAAPLSIAQTPLLVSTTVDPNTMLLIDDSGSMDHIMWHDAYDPNTAYPGDYGTNTSYFTNSAGWYSLNGRNYRLPHPAGAEDHSTRWSGNYLNWISGYFAAGTDLTGGLIPNATRMQTARTAATSFVTNTSGMRFGLASFNTSDGGRIRANCGSTTANVNSAISGLRADNWTPLAESLYEVTRYFRGMSSYYGSSIPGGDSTYTSPIQYRCQKNFAIVITDGLPTYDMHFPGPQNDPVDIDPDDQSDTSAALPNWDGLAPATPVTTPQVFPQYSDGHVTGAENAEGYSLYLDDVAKFGYDIDMKTTGADLAGGSYQASNFMKQNMHTYTIGFTVANQMLQDAASYGRGLYFTANTASQLTSALQSAISHVFETSSSASSVAANSTRLNTDTKIYQARFNSQRWSGDLLAYPINSNGSVGSATLYAASNIPAYGSRTIYAYNATATPKGVPFTWSGASTQLSPAQQTALNTNISGVNDGLGASRVSYLRGDRSLEVQNGNGGTFRNRASTLGDIVNSDPHYVGTPDYRYHLLPGSEGEAYRTFRESSSYKNRTPMLYVGANDGMLHAFNAATLTESFAFIPGDVFSNLSALTSPSYSHKFFVDGSPRSGDAYIGGAWKTILVSGLRAGGKAIFALDITNPAGFSGDKVLWEFTDATNLGYTFSQPTIIRLRTGDWAAVFGNGYNSTAQTAQLFIINLATGALIKRIDTGIGSTEIPNGLSTPAPVDVEGDRITDYVYAGDLYGNMWKFDLTSNNSNSWDVAYTQGTTKHPLYRAVSGSGVAQPITSRPEIGVHPVSGTNGGLMVYFGTGKYLESGDNTVPANAPGQTFYGIRDNGTRVSGGLGDLQQQTITLTTGSDGSPLRIVSANTVATAKRGWYVNLPENGERSVSNPVLRSGRIIFTTLTPSADPCAYGGTSWLMEIDATTGARLSYPVFDLNDDRNVNDQDRLTDGTSPSGQKFDGLIPTPEIVGAGEIEYKYMSSSSGTVETVTELGDNQSARQSWRQIR